MSDPFNLGATPQSWATATGLVTLVEGASFCICSQTGDISPDQAQGYFFRDARLVSRWELHIDGHRIEPLSVQPSDPFAGLFVARPRPRHGHADDTLLVVRRRLVGHAMREDLTIRNLGNETTAVTATLVVEADFADLFAVKAGRDGAVGAFRVEMDSGRLELWPEDRDDDIGLVVRSDCGDPVITPNTLTFQVVIPPRSDWHVCLEALPAVEGEELPSQSGCAEPVEASPAAQRLSAWRRSTTRIQTGHPRLAAALERSSADLGSLRIFDPSRPDLPVVAAGVPWYMTLFGRDSLLTSWMALLIDPQLALGTVRALAELQGRKVDPVSEEEPGRILHELRHGSAFGAQLKGDSIYYGTADATPLFVMLVGELYRWGFGDAVRPLIPNVDRALKWITDYGDRDGDGFVEYKRATDKGLRNQGWKDSWDGVSFHDGRFAEPPIALCEVQAYVYGALEARATIARAENDPAGAALFASRASRFKEAFNQRFWLPDRGFVAYALDRDKRPVDAMTSNAGHCLWTGILDQDKAEQVADYLLSGEMFTGWGIRTLSSTAGRYNPVSYHNGSVWPHDTALIVAGLARYGFAKHVERIATALIEAAEAFDGRLPELFCGFDRAEFPQPVQYPSSCSPQAWAAAAPLLLVRSLLGFSPDLTAGILRVTPSIPAEFGELRLDGLQIAGDRLSIVASGTHAQVHGFPAGGRLHIA